MLHVSRYTFVILALFEWVYGCARLWIVLFAITKNIVQHVPSKCKCWLPVNVDAGPKIGPASLFHLDVQETGC
jgi:hypothetical protein